MSGIRVAVATQGPPPLLRGCLDALAREGAAPGSLVVVSAVPAAERDALVSVAQASGVTVLEEPRPGASRARNRALAECADDDVVAFVDDDTIVCPGWFSALRAAWGRAGPAVGCIGGPIEVDLVGAAPAWITPLLLSAYSRLDLGERALEVDTSEQAVAGPNMSFRASALRAVGGFDPAYGHTGRRMWFGEEHEAQRALGRLGYKVRYEPGARVLHTVAADTVTPLALLHRRLLYGATLHQRGGRSRALAARRCAVSAAGVLAAATHRDRRLAMVRAFRSAENAGVLLAPLLRPPQASTSPRRIA